MKAEVERDGLIEGKKEELEVMEKSLDIEKSEFLRLKKDEIIPFLEEEIAVRYYFQEAGVKVRIKYDQELRQALNSPLIEIH